ncbi:MAG: AI-2E family transporter [Burkholderiaceae bacterium]
MPLTPRQTQTALWTAIAVVLAVVLLNLGPVLTPFIMAAILAYALEPGVVWLHKMHLPRGIGAIIMVTLTFVSFSLLLLIVLPIVQQEVSEIRDRLPGVINTITRDLLPWLQQKTGMDLTIDVASIREWLTQNVTTFGDDVAARVFAYAKSGWGAALQILSLLFLVPVVAYFLLVDWDHMLEQLHSLIPLRWEAEAMAMIREVDGLLGQYFRGQVRVLLIMAAYYSVTLYIAGYKLWAPIGVLSGLLMAIPYLGFTISMVFALIDGMLQFGPLKAVIVVAIIYGVAQVLESTFLTPRLVGERIGLHPVAVIFALLAFGAVFGFAGVLLALPLAAALAVALRRLRGAYRDSEFFNREADS